MEAYSFSCTTAFEISLGEKNKLFVWLHLHQITIRGEMISSTVISKLYTKEKGLGA